MEISRLTRDGTTEPVSRDQILRRGRGQRNMNFPCSAHHVQDSQPYLVDPYSCFMRDHTYIRVHSLIFVFSHFQSIYNKSGPPIIHTAKSLDFIPGEWIGVWTRPVSTRFRLIMGMSRLTRHKTAEPVSRDQILRRERAQGNIIFSFPADHKQDWQPYPMIDTLAICDEYTC